MEIKYTTATHIANEQGVKTAVIAALLQEKGFIVPRDEPRKWDITDEGAKLGARYSKNREGVEYILWPICPSINEIRKINAIHLQTLNEKVKRADTEGEQFIKEFFEDVGISYKFQEAIRNLSHDEKGHRIADFYLPKYDTYVEFFGRWNAGAEFKESYKRKQLVYKQNRIACVFIYPENLGYLHFSFDHRLIETLKELHKEKELNRYKSWKLINSIIGNLIGVGISVPLLFYFQNEGKVIMGLVFLYNLYAILRISYLIFVKERYSLMKVLNE